MGNILIPEFTPVLRTQIIPSRARLAGQPDYLDERSKESFRKMLINELMPRNGNLKRYESWYLGYYLQPYMNNLNREEFLRRWADIQDNMSVITENNKIGVHDISKNDAWMIRFSELLAESQFRGGIPNNTVASETILKNISLNRFAHPSLDVRQLPYVFKFGKREHLLQMQNTGTIRLANSSSYQSNSMNHGQKDDENNFTFTVFPELLKKLDGQTGLANIDPVGRKEIIKITHQEPQDYLMWCAAYKYDFRIPYAFDAEAVAVITEPRRFKKDVTRSLKENGLISTVGKVRYFDPYLDLRTKLDVRFSKHFRFSYQNEYRIVAQGNNLPDHFFLTIPDLPKYCEIHELK